MARDRAFVTAYANSRQLIAWVLGLGENARMIGPPELVEELRERVARSSSDTPATRQHRRSPPTPRSCRRAPTPVAGLEPAETNGHRQRRGDPA